MYARNQAAASAATADRRAASRSRLGSACRAGIVRGQQRVQDLSFFAGPFNPRADASKCDPEPADQEELTRWLREAIVAGQCGQLWEGDFPRYAWCQHGGVTYEARLSNPELGQYKGYPLEPDERVEGLT